MQHLARIAFLFGALLLLPAAVLAQGPAGGGDPTSRGSEMTDMMSRPQTQKSVAGRVYSTRGGVLSKAGVEITNDAGAKYQYAVTDKAGDFRADFNLFDASMNRQMVVTLKVVHKGYQPAHKIVVLNATTSNLSIAINMRPEAPEDPNLLSLNDLIKGLTPRLRQLSPADGIAPKEMNDYSRGVQEFLDRGHVERAVPDFARVASLSPKCLKCSTMLGLAELDWGDWDDARKEFSTSVNALIEDHKLACPEPLIAYGVLTIWRRDPAKAGTYLLAALTYAPKDPLALEELGRAQYQEMNWYAANLTLEKAIAAGAGPEAKLLRAEALLYAGTPQEASDELNSYMDGRPFKSMPAQAQTLWANIQVKFKDADAFEAATVQAKSRGELPLDYIQRPPTKGLQDFTPAKDQQPLKAILASVGKNVDGLFTYLPNICAVEKVRQEKLDHKGNEEASHESKYRYLALIPEHPWGPSIDEYRADSGGRGESSLTISDDSMLTEGFVSAPLVFHPEYQAGSTFVLLGTQTVNGRREYLVAYAQIPAKSSLSGTFTLGTNTRMTYTQGIAWIDAETYQVVRITSDLLQPLPEVRLDKETTDIIFDEVQFKQVTQKFWLPETVTVTLNWNGRSYRNNHAYSDFLVSNVDEIQRIGKPKEAAKTTEDSSGRPRGSTQPPAGPGPSSVPQAN